MSGLDGLADVVVGWGEMRLRLQRQGGKDDAKAMSILAAKFWSFPDCFEIAGNHVHRPSFAAKAESSRKNEAGVGVVRSSF